ncbi:MAG: GTPase ObgE [Deltaproteobacteria bacterium]|nr:GTPase ObgE [Deltaproteobacteria bacterium]MBW2614623.1 GTPase ObgE [Deltaproteobacteria bacterium]
MIFLDEAFITAQSGDGGKGCVSFRREKFIPKGGPDGGDGGNGGSIIVRASIRHHTLTDYSSRKYLKAEKGQPGRGKNQSGKNGADLIFEVPLGTIIEDVDTGELLGDLIHDNQELVLIAGGKGGKGNKRFATSTNRAPRIAQPGLPGKERRLKLSLKFLADIGLIGLPNAGKSTLLSRLSMARPRVDSYPFTTIFPNLGVMSFDDESSLIIADIPGLIEGASQGRGLGHRFLKHIERTKLLLHVLDITFHPDQDIIEDFHTLIREMNAFNPQLARKPQMVLVNKMDIYGPEHRDLKALQKALEESGVESLPISALTGEGLEELKKVIREKWIYGER